MDTITSAATARTAAHAHRAPRAYVEVPTRSTVVVVADLVADGACPVCLACTDPAVAELPGDEHPGVAPATCPECGRTSLEYGLTVAMNDVLGSLSGLARLDAAL